MESKALRGAAGRHGRLSWVSREVVGLFVGFRRMMSRLKELQVHEDSRLAVRNGHGKVSHGKSQECQPTWGGLVSSLGGGSLFRVWRTLNQATVQVEHVPGGREHLGR